MFTQIFRGKRKDNGEWIESYSKVHVDPLKEVNAASHGIYLSDSKVKAYITRDKNGNINKITENNGAFYFKIDEKTFGSFTGITDKNGKKIFEGDIVKYNKRANGLVVWCDNIAAFEIKYYIDDYEFCTTLTDYCEVIGNIHDNPELFVGG